MCKIYAMWIQGSVQRLAAEDADANANIADSDSADADTVDVQNESS